MIVRLIIVASKANVEKNYTNFENWSIFVSLTKIQRYFENIVFQIKINVTQLRFFFFYANVSIFTLENLILLGVRS